MAPITRKPSPRSKPRVDRRRQILQVRSEWGVPQRVFARMMTCTERTIGSLERGRPLSPAQARRLREIERLREALAEVVNPDVISGWLQEPNPAFDGATPLQVIERGEMDRLWSMIFYLQSGVTS